MNILQETFEYLVGQEEKMKASIKVKRQECQESQKKADADNEELDRMQAALEKFQEFKRDFKQGGKKKSAAKTTKSGNDKPNNVKQHHVIQLCRQVVSKKPGIGRDELETFVQKKLKENTELCMRGYDKRFKETMKKPEFRVDEEDRVWLSSDSEPEAKVSPAIVSPSSEPPVESLPESRAR